MSRLFLLLILIPFQAYAGGFMFNNGPITVPAPAAPAPVVVEAPKAPVIAPPSPTRPNFVTIQPSQPAGRPKVMPGEDERTEAGLDCPTGTCPGPRNPAFTRIDVAKIGGNSSPPTPPRRPATSTGNACLRNLILESAKSVVSRLYGNRPYSGGWCARGVRRILNGSGVTTGSMGDAVTWHTRGKLKAQGFENIMNQGYTAETAPPGAVLIFRGPATDMSSPSGGLPPKRKRRGRGAGTWVGHVSVKGEKANRYYTDGRTEDPAVAGRTLVGIYVPVKCVNCSGAAARCGAQ